VDARTLREVKDGAGHRVTAAVSEVWPKA